MNIKYLLIGFGLIFIGLYLTIKIGNLMGQKSLKDFFLGSTEMSGILILFVGILFIGSGFGWW